MSSATAHPHSPLPPLHPLALGRAAPIRTRYTERHQAHPHSPLLPLHPLALGRAAPIRTRYTERHQAHPHSPLPPLHPPALGSLQGKLTAPYNSNVQRPLARMAHSLHFSQAAQASAHQHSAFDNAHSAHTPIQAQAQQAQPIAQHTIVRDQIAHTLGEQQHQRNQTTQPLRQQPQWHFQTATPLQASALTQPQRLAARLHTPRLLDSWQLSSRSSHGHFIARYQRAGIQPHQGLHHPPAPAYLHPLDNWRDTSTLEAGYDLWPPKPPHWHVPGLALEFAAPYILGRFPIRASAAPVRTWDELQSSPLASGAQLGQPLQSAPITARWQYSMPAPSATAWPEGLEPGPGPGPDPDPPEPGHTILITTRRAYIVQNEITLTRLDSGAQLQAHSFSMSLDYQSWTWSWQASLHHSAAAHLGRDAQGDPAELLASINGVNFRLRLERIARERRHLPQERFSVSGKGRAAILDAPWAPQMVFGTSPITLTAQQLAMQVLTINNVPIGWDVDWQLTDWLVPAGAWVHQGSYISALNDIAQAAGGYVQPHNTEAVLRILHQYPTAPWEWGSVTPDIEIPAAVTEMESTEYLDKPAYNRVYVGGQSQGVFGPMTRAGTAGELLAPQATHPLITAAAAWQQRARTELSDTGRQERIRLSLPVLPETGVIVPGQFVRYVASPSTPTIGIVRATHIDWQRPRLRQTLEIEAHEPV